MHVEHYELASDLVFPCVTFPASDTMPEQIADHAEYRFSMIALRRQGGEAPWELFREEHQLVVVDPMFHQALGVLLDLVQRRRPVQPGRGEAGLAVITGTARLRTGTTFFGNRSQTFENTRLSCTFEAVNS